MRIAIVSVAAALLVPIASAHARADDCAGPAAASRDCNALDKGGAMSMSAGYAAVPFDPRGHTFSVTNPGYVNQIGQVDGNSFAPIHADGFFLDVRVHMTPHWYFGVDVTVGWAGSLQPRFVTDGATANWTAATIGTLGGVVGVRLPLGRLSVRAELVGGLHDGVLRGMSASGQAVEADAPAPLLEPRVAVDLWAADHLVLEAFAGVNALDRTEQTFGLGLGFHSQAFDGRY